MNQAIKLERTRSQAFEKQRRDACEQAQSDASLVQQQNDTTEQDHSQVSSEVCLGNITKDDELAVSDQQKAKDNSEQVQRKYVVSEERSRATPQIDLSKASSDQKCLKVSQQNGSAQVLDLMTLTLVF
jgi:hypothetical protein